MLELHFFADQHKLWHDPVVLLQITMCSHAYWWCLPNQGMSLALSRTELSFFTWQKENATGQETPSVSCGWRAAHWVKVDGYKNCTNGMWFFFCLLYFLYHHYVAVKTDDMKHMDYQVTPPLRQGRHPNHRLQGCLFLSLSFLDFPRETHLQEQKWDSFIIC